MKQKRYHIVLASILFAILMWTSINFGYDYTITRQIPVVLENMKDGTALRFPIPRQMTVRFRGTGWQLAAIFLSPEVKYFIDVSTLSRSIFMITEADLPEHVKLPVAVQTIDVQPETLLLALDTYAEKRVPIMPQAVLFFKEGYGQVGPIRIQPESVVVAGAASIVEGIGVWHTVFKRFDEQRFAIDEMIQVEGAESYTVEVYPRSVRLHLDVQPFAEKTIAGITVNAISTPTGREVIFIPPRMDVTVRGGIDQLARLSEADFQATVDFNLLVQDSIPSVTPLFSSPEGIRVLRKSPERFQFFIRKRL